MLKKIKLNIGGIHCKSCKTLIETELDVLPGVSEVNVDYTNSNATIEFDDKKIDLKKINKELGRLGYKPEINTEDEKATKQPASSSTKKSFILGFMIPVIIFILIGGYILIQKYSGFELMAQLNEGNVGYGIILIIGLLAGFHCVGMCGGLVVAYSASELKKEKKSLKPHFHYNLGRLISYTVLGAILGGIGSFFGINPTFTGVVILVAGIFMILMGLSFVTGWSVLEKIKLRTPQFIARFIYNQKHSKKSKGPFIVGLLNGFMPCGPLQAMQLYALASGSVFRGGMSMAIYALGTIPLMFGFGTVLSSIGQKHMKKIFKFSGALIIILGIIMANRGLTNFGYGFDNLSFNNKPTIDRYVPSNNKDFQVVNMDLSYLGYNPNILYIKEGVPVRWVINVTQMTGCTDSIMIESLGIKQDLVYGENVIEFTPPSGVKEIKFSCWMRMVWGKFVITKNDNPTSAEIQKGATDLPSGGGCNGSCGGGCGGGSSCGCGG